METVADWAAEEVVSDLEEQFVWEGKERHCIEEIDSRV